MGDRRFKTQSSRNREPGIAQRADGHAARPYRHLSLLELVRRIVKQSDRRALAELHDFRPVFRHQDEGRLRLVEYVHQLYEQARKRVRNPVDENVLEMACDLTVDKFSHLPGHDESRVARGHRCQHAADAGGPDCRRYFNAFLRQADARLGARLSGELAREELAARLLQHLVHRHFRFSRLEAARRAVSAMRRYTWRTPHGDIRVWLPVELPAAECRQWLECHTEGIDLGTPDAAELVRAVAREELGSREFVYFSASGCIDPPAPVPSPPRTWDLAGLVAEEKAEQIHHQRPTIKSLGTGKLMMMIHQIFEDLEADEYNESQTARDAGLKKPTVSRFAGKEWLDEPDRQRAKPPPDLWCNTAQVIAAHPDLVDAAKDAGVWDQVQEVCRRAPR